MSTITSEASEVFWNHHSALSWQGHHQKSKALIKRQRSLPPPNPGSALVWLLWGADVGGGNAPHLFLSDVWAYYSNGIFHIIGMVYYWNGFNSGSFQPAICHPVGRDELMDPYRLLAKL